MRTLSSRMRQILCLFWYMIGERTEEFVNQDGILSMTRLRRDVVDAYQINLKSKSRNDREAFVDWEEAFLRFSFAWLTCKTGHDKEGFNQSEWAELMMMKRNKERIRISDDVKRDFDFFYLTRSGVVNGYFVSSELKDHRWRKQVSICSRLSRS